jgi:hypothetical protein
VLCCVPRPWAHDAPAHSTLASQRLTPPGERPSAARTAAAAPPRRTPRARPSRRRPPAAAACAAPARPRRATPPAQPPRLAAGLRGPWVRVSPAPPAGATAARPPQLCLLNVTTWMLCRQTARPHVWLPSAPAAGRLCHSAASAGLQMRTELSEPVYGDTSCAGQAMGSCAHASRVAHAQHARVQEATSRGRYEALLLEFFCAGHSSSYVYVLAGGGDGCGTPAPAL